MAISLIDAQQSAVSAETTATATINSTDADYVVAYSGGKRAATGMTFNGVAMVASANNSADTAFAQWFYLMSSDLPSTGGSNNAVATYASTVAAANAIVGAIALRGVGQAAPEATASTSSTSASTSAQTMPITTLTDGAWILDVAVANSTTLAPGSTSTGQELLLTLEGATLEVAASRKLVPTAASTDMSWTQTTTSAGTIPFAYAAIALKPNLPPTVALDSPADEAVVNDTTPSLAFTGTDVDGNDITFQVQIADADFAPSLLFSDDFNRADSTSAGVNYDYPGDFALAIASNKGAANSDLDDIYAIYNGALGTNDYEVEVDMNMSAASEYADGSILARYQDVDNYYELQQWIFGGQLILAKVVAGSWTEINHINSGVARNENHTYKLKVQGNVLTVYMDDIEVMQETDNEFASGGAGLWATGHSAATLLFDNFSITGLGPTPIIDAVSGVDAGFVNNDNGGDTNPFTSGDEIGYTVQAGDELSVDTYYWRVRAIDPTGSNEYGAWSATRSFDVTAASTESITKDLKYTVIKAVSAITKALKYTVLKAFTLQKSLRYAINETPTALTKSLQYVVQAAHTLQKSLKYTVTNPVAAVQKSLQYAIVTATTLQKSLQYLVKATPSAIEKSLQYVVIVAKTLQKSLKYTVYVTPATITKALKYTILTTDAITKSLEYVVQATETYAITKDLTYAVLKTRSITKGLVYALKPTYAITKALQYAVRATKSVTKSLRYAVVNPSAITKSLKYTLLTSGLLQKSLRYAVVLAGQGITKSLRYAVRATYAVTKQLKYAVASVGAIQKALKYAVRSGTTVQKQVKYTVVTTGVITKSLHYIIYRHRGARTPLPSDRWVSPIDPVSGTPVASNRQVTELQTQGAKTIL